MSGYYNVTISINPYSEDAADLLAAFLAEIGFESFEQSEGSVNAYIQAGDYNSSALKEVLHSFPMDVELKWEKQLIPHTDWNEEWEKRYFKPMILAQGRCVVHSSFHTDIPDAEVKIVVDPKMAFGTGHHATTAMMVAHLFDADLRGKRIIDMGTGTGILAIIAKKLGAGDVTGVEIDEGAFENALENAALNHTDISLIHGNVTAIEGMHDVDFFLANINRNIILADLDKYVATLSPFGRLVLSGFYESDIPLIKAALESYGMEIATIELYDGNWASVVAKRSL